jgi:hypothetical protein
LLLVFYDTSVENSIVKRFSWASITLASLAGFLVLLPAAVSIQAQEDPQPSRDPVVFKAQLRQASVLGRRSIREIQALSIDDSVPVDPQVRHNARQVYVLLRAGRWGMELAMQRETTYHDPMLRLAHKRVDQAWNLARTAVDGTSLPRAEYVSVSVRDLTRAVQLIDQALVIIP